ncbi:MAG: HAD-IA family hydrolase [Nanoarchaeota archaeon]|nr:HAD-IA family hydrolase [Nanoarchaeota archaeon]MBU1321013.1 HAD-IA family hydrolase [Nanoarchaeota archaeon]MBU1597517.1 HAD-IA family hydrolase [Nanoarchaeota archaeon]MBU2441676.1 HAD-IA family hydrolase [Nanoarchaeota archaeon]
MIKAIIFDWFRVLTKENWSDCLMRELNQKYGLDKTIIKEAFNKYHQPFARDIISSEEFLDKFIKTLKIKEDPKNFKYLFEKIPVLNNELFDLVLKLKKKYTVALFSNNFRPVFANYDVNLKKYFDEVFLSYELGLNKIHDEIWNIIIKKLTFEPSEILFVDDNDKYLHYAKNKGIKTIHFKDVEQLKKELNLHGVDVE